MTRRIPAVHERWALAVPLGKLMEQARLSSVSKLPSVDIRALIAVGKAPSQSKAR